MEDLFILGKEQRTEWSNRGMPACGERRLVFGLLNSHIVNFFVSDVSEADLARSSDE